MPLLSVILPNFNHARYLPDRVNSILQQTFTDLEIICLDDASTDNSIEILETYRLKHNLILLKNSRNSGNPFIQWNKGVNIASGDFIWIAESDDFADPRMLEYLFSLLNNNPNVGLAYCQSFYIDENNEILGTHLKDLQKLNDNLWQNDFIYDGRKMLASYMSIFNVIPNASGVLFRKQVFSKIGGAVEDMRLCGDWLTWSKMLTVSDLGFIATPLNYFRIHKHSLRSEVHREQQYIMECLKVLQYISSHVETDKRSIKKASSRLKSYWLSIVINNPKSITTSGILEIFKKSHSIFGLIDAIVFLFIGLLFIITLIPTVHAILRLLVKFYKKITTV